MPIFNYICKFIVYVIKSKFSEHVLEEGHEMKIIGETTSIIHHENNHRKINTLEEIEIRRRKTGNKIQNFMLSFIKHRSNLPVTQLQKNIEHKMSKCTNKIIIRGILSL